jgi:hypothetical protein
MAERFQTQHAGLTVSAQSTHHLQELSPAVYKHCTQHSSILGIVLATEVLSPFRLPLLNGTDPAMSTTRHRRRGE